MAEQKKSHKAGRHQKQNELYKMQGRRYNNALKRIKRHIKKQPDDQKAKKWLEFLSTIMSMDYKRGNAALKKKWETLFGR